MRRYMSRYSLASARGDTESVTPQYASCGASCVDMYVRVSMSMFIYMYAHTCLCVYLHVCIRDCVFISMCVHIHVCVFTYMCVHILICVFIYMCMHIRVCVFTFYVSTYVFWLLCTCTYVIVSILSTCNTKRMHAHGIFMNLTRYISKIYTQIHTYVFVYVNTYICTCHFRLQGGI
jgi:hypothetical protein